MLQSQNRAKKVMGAAATKNKLKIIDPGLPPGMDRPNPDYKLDLSKPIGSVEAPSVSLPSVSAPDLPKIPESRAEPPEIKKPDINTDEIMSEVKAGSIKRPAIIFVKGLDIFSSPSTSEGGYAGVGKMAQAVEGSRMYGWDQHDEIVDHLKKIHKDQPVILVGHSFGGDTAHEVADTLDSLEHGFRKVDLLITIDSVGAGHDVIPQNVKNHMNVFGENNFFLNDGPHVARRDEMTKVKNILSPLDHTDLDDNKEIQFEIVNLINETLSKKA